jgi:SAM-dependent methyltransferase
MKAAEFDRFAEEYLADHARNIRISGESPEYFARYKVDEVRRRWSASQAAYLASAFPSARVTGIDVSAKSLEIAGKRFPDAATLVEYDGGALPFPQASFDLVFSACVFHHIEAEEHERLFRGLRELLRPGGWLVIFEHNPLNPLTRAVVGACPFDENAVLIPARTLKARLQASGFGEVEIAYTAFFPRVLAGLRRLEGALARLPLGAQYYALAHR